MACIIGIDVGGTNTDAVVIKNREVLARTKVTTTKDVTTGVLKAIHGVLMELRPQEIQIQQINLGTTHFINSVVQRSPELARVGVIRIATRPNTKSVPAFFDFPNDLKQLLDGGYYIVSGGCDFDGSEIDSINEGEIIQELDNFVGIGIKNFVLISTFSPVKTEPEERVYEIIKKHFGSEISCTLSHKIGQLGFIERENASILNESLKPLCQKTLSNLQSALEKLNLKCPLFISQNDGTIVTLEYAIEHPVITFSSGPTNSMRGAAFISGVKDAIVVDIGGTSTDVGVLIKGFPRLTGTHVNVGGIRTNFRMPDTNSIGLGGGSRVRKHADGLVTIGPDSVGYRLTKEALSFGGHTLTATDIVAYSGNLRTPKKPELEPEFANKVLSSMQTMIEEAIDSMKTSSEAIPVILVGGGSVLVKPDAKLAGSSETIRPQNAEVANAIGSALCQVSGRIDIMSAIDPNVPNAAEKALEKLKNSAIEEAVNNGAVRETVELVDVEFIPVSYLPGNAVRIKVVAVGELDVQSHSAVNIDWNKFPENLALHEDSEGYENIATDLYNPQSDISLNAKSSEINKINGIWKLTEDDVEKISIGAAILGCGGGGNPYLGKLRVLDQLRHGKTISVVSLERLLKEDLSQFSPYVVSVGYMGAPAVMTERLHSKIEVLTAFQALQAYIAGKLDSYKCQTDETGVEYLRFDKLLVADLETKPFLGVMPLEIGGINSTEPLGIAAEINSYCLDADLMGRAFPELQMMTPYIYGHPCTPFAMASWRGEVVIAKNASGPKQLEDFARKICVEFGCSAGTAESPIPVEKLRDYCILGSITRCLELGKAVLDARKSKKDPIQEILSIEKGKILCSGKVTFVDRKTIGGFNRGYFILHDLNDGSKKKVDFQNENLVVWDSDKPLAMVPDLIVVLDTDTGEPIITDDMRYGLRATIVILAPPELLTTKEALKVIGPAAFGYTNLDYTPAI